MPGTSSGGLPAYPGLEDSGHDSAHADKASHNSELSDDSGIVDYKDPKSVVENNRNMLVNQLSCDVQFIVGDKKEKIGAHKYVLMTRSLAFKHMFSGPNGGKSEFVVPEITGDNFWEMLRHIYCEEQRIQVTSVVGILYAADQYGLVDLKQKCLDFLHACLEINNACYLLNETRTYGYLDEEKTILSFIRKNCEDVFKTVGMNLLPRDLLNDVLTLPGLDIDESVKRDVADKWAKNQCKETKIEVNEETVMDSLQDCLYVYRDDDGSHRYVLDSLTTRNLLEEPLESLELPNQQDKSRTDDVDGVSTLSSNTSMRSSVHTYSRLPSCNMWADVEQITRLQEVHKSDTNDASQPDAISFTVDQNIYLYGFSIYGPKKEGEGKYKIDTILTKKKKDIVMETIIIKGAGVILPVMFERPIKIDKGIPYTLEIYISGPASYLGSSGQSKVTHGTMLFTFSNATKVKKNRSDVTHGQIPRLYFMPRNK